MSPPPLRQFNLGGLVETLAIGSIGGLAFGLAGLPAGYVAGSIICVAAAALMGRPMGIPAPLTRVVFVVIGISLGAIVTPETLAGVTAWPLSILVLGLSVVCVVAATSLYLRTVHGWDAQSALCAASPGALSQVMVMATEMGADIRGVAIVQTMRVAILVGALPGALAMFGLTGTAAPLGGSIGFGSDLIELAFLIVGSSAVAALLYFLRFPGGLIFGAMVGSAVLHGTGLVEVRMPWWVANAAMIALGAVTGSRFANTTLRMLLSYIGAAFGSFLVAVIVSSVFAVALTYLLPLRTADVVIAFAPGALDAMMILALAMHLDPVYVGAHHLARFVVVSLMLPVAASRVARPGLPPRREDGQPRKRVPPQD